MDGLEIIGIDKYIEDIPAVLRDHVDEFICRSSVKITCQFQVKAVSGFKRINVEIARH
jgi:hypothetical protein